MNVLILTETEAEELTALNASGEPARQLAPATLDDGRLALNADLLTDCGPGQTWAHYEALLDGLELADVMVSEFVVEVIL
jgi:hypothetical protein